METQADAERVARPPRRGGDSVTDARRALNTPRDCGDRERPLTLAASIALLRPPLGDEEEETRLRSLSSGGLIASLTAPSLPGFPLLPHLFDCARDREEGNKPARAGELQFSARRATSSACLSPSTPGPDSVAGEGAGCVEFRGRPAKASGMRNARASSRRSWARLIFSLEVATWGYWGHKGAAMRATASKGRTTT